MTDLEVLKKVAKSVDHLRPGDVHQLFDRLNDSLADDGSDWFLLLTAGGPKVLNKKDKVIKAYDR